MSPRRPWVVRAYARALLILPLRVRREDAAAMAETFDDLWAEGKGTTRLGHAARAFGRLPLVAVAEWLDALGITGGTAALDASGSKGGRSMGWGTHVRFALRSLGKAPGFALTTVLLVGLGVGAVTTIFTLVDHVLLRQLPYPDADRLVLLENGSHSGVLWEEFNQMSSVDLWAASSSRSANLVGEGNPIRIIETVVSEDFFRMFDARPAMGRLLVRDDFRAADNVLLSHAMWRRVFGGAQDIVGRTIRVDGEALTVVGVLSGDFVSPEGLVNSGEAADVWRPIDWSDEGYARPGRRVLRVAGRLAPGVTLETAAAETEQVNRRMAERYPDNYVDRQGNMDTTPPAFLQEVTTRRVRPGLNLLLGAVVLLLVVACLNIAHLFLARGLGRTREMAVRRALGANTVGLVNQLLVESVILGVAGGVLGVGLASLGVRTFLSLNPSALPWAGDVTVDLRVLAFAAAVSVLTALAFGLLPALRSVGRDLTEELRGGNRSASTGRRTFRLRSSLVIAEVATSLVLVTQAGLLLKSFINVNTLDPGFGVEGVWTLPLTPNGLEGPEYVEAMDRIRASLAAVPGVTTATYGLSQPFEFTGGGRCCWSRGTILADGVERQDLRIFLQPVSQDYLSTLEIPLVAGTAWPPGESRQEPWPVVLAERLALELFGSAPRAVGQVLEVGPDTRVRVTGVAGDIRYYGLDQELPASIYVPIERVPFDIDMAHFAVRVAEEPPSGLASSLREAVWAASPGLPVPTVRNMVEWVGMSTAGRRFDSVLFATFGVLALLLASAGLYGTLLYSVGEQRQELGIRLALGAGRTRVQRRVVGRGLGLAVVGAVLGLGGTWLVGRYLESRLYGMLPTDPATLGSAVVVLLAAAALASWMPARRASRTDPLQTLKAE
jgi:putative ABC transport system permease protein